MRDLQIESLLGMKPRGVKTRKLGEAEKHQGQPTELTEVKEAGMILKPVKSEMADTKNSKRRTETSV